MVSSVVEWVRWGHVVATSCVVPEDSIEMYECHSVDVQEHCDILNVVGIGAPPAWRMNKYILPRTLMQTHGVSTGYCYVTDGEVATWEVLLRKATPSVVIVRGMLLNPSTAEILAFRYPEIKFVHICHSAMAFAATESQLVPRIISFINLTKRYCNLYYAHPNKDEVTAMKVLYAGTNAAITWLPNVLQHCGLVKRKFDSRKVRVFLTCMWRPMKNMVGQILAAAVAARRLPVQFYLAIPDAGRDGVIKSIIDAINTIPDFNITLVDWKENDDYIEWMARNVDIVMQCSFTESFNYVAWEAMDLGIPVVGSPAIDYANVSVNPDSLIAMADAIERIAENYEYKSHLAAVAAQEVLVNFNSTYVQEMLFLLGRN